MSLYRERETYLLYSKLPAYKKKIDKAQKIIEGALGGSKNPYLSFSGGKDSIVMLDLAVKSGFRGEMVFFRYGISVPEETPQETEEIVRHYEETYGLTCHTVPCLGEFDCWEELGYFCLFPESKEEKRVFHKTNMDFKKQAKSIEEAQGYDLNFIGMRKKESKTRDLMLARKGYLYQTKDRDSATCCPLAEFNGKDIWAYIFAHQLKYPSCYDYPYKSRETIRNEPTLLYKPTVIEHGGLEYYKTLYPEYIEEIKKRYPGTLLG